MNILSRFKSPVVVSAILAIIFIVGKEFFGVDLSVAADVVLDTALALVAAFGVVNNPTDKNHL